MLTRHRTIILDDDPTGTQAASSVEVLFSFEESDFLTALATQSTIFVLTNTRSLDEAAAVELVSSIRRNALAAAASLGVSVDFVLRGDSTLRGHVFAESAVFMTENAVMVFCPAFPDGGRLTRQGIHYLMGSDKVERPVHLTEYAKDPVFGFDTSDLVRFAHEHTGRPAISVAVPTMRTGGSPGIRTRPTTHEPPHTQARPTTGEPTDTQAHPTTSQLTDTQTHLTTSSASHARVDPTTSQAPTDTLSSILMDAPGGATIMPDVESNEDIPRIAAAIRLAQATRPIVVRSAAPLAVELGGVASHGLMSFSDLGPRLRSRGNTNTGRVAGAQTARSTVTPELTTPPDSPKNLPTPRVLVVCGSHTAAATAQLDALNAKWPGRAVVDTELALTDPPLAVARTVADLIALWEAGRIAVLSTERVRRANHATLTDGAAVMAALIEVVRQVADRADVVISKGGITSADVAERGLDGRSATVLGQLAIGISLWEVHTNSGEDRPLIVVPGNVGHDATLVHLVEGLF